MITGKAVIEMGIGDVMVTPLTNNIEGSTIGAICFNQSVPGEINRKMPITDKSFSEAASVIFAFSKVESIDVVIDSLKWLKRAMNNELKEDERLTFDEPFKINIME